MSARLADLFAPEWEHQLGKQVHKMLPLCLATFAKLEMYGISLQSLNTNDLDTWVNLYCRLASIDPAVTANQIKLDFASNPLDLQLFQHKFAESFQEGGLAGSTSTTIKPRRVQHPLKPQNENEEESTLDMSDLVTMSRISGISLFDLSRMSFRGLAAVEYSLKEMPPMPPTLPILPSR